LKNIWPASSCVKLSITPILQPSNLASYWRS
jgi:hypothetical protein